MKENSSDNEDENILNLLKTQELEIKKVENDSKNFLNNLKEKDKELAKILDNPISIEKINKNDNEKTVKIESLNKDLFMEFTLQNQLLNGELKMIINNKETKIKFKNGKKD